MSLLRANVLIILSLICCFVAPNLSHATNKSRALTEIRPVLAGNLSLCLAKQIESNSQSVAELRQQLTLDVEQKDFQTAFRKLNSGFRDLPETEIQMNDFTTSVLFLLKIQSVEPLSPQQIKFGKLVSKFLIQEPENSEAVVYGFKFLQLIAYQQNDLRGLLDITKQSTEKLTGNQPLVRSTLVELNQRAGLILHRNNMIELAMKSYVSNKDADWSVLKLETIWRGYHLACELGRSDDAQQFLDQINNCPVELQASSYYRELARLAELESGELETYRELATLSYLPVALESLSMQKAPWFNIALTLPPANELSKEGVIQLMFQAVNNPYAFRKLSLLVDKPPVFVKRSLFYRLFVDFGSQISISEPLYQMPVILARSHSAMELNDVSAAKKGYEDIYQFLESNSIPNNRWSLLNRLGLYISSKDASMIQTCIERLGPSLRKKIGYHERNEHLIGFVELLRKDAKWQPVLDAFLEEEISYQKKRGADAAFLALLNGEGAVPEPQTNVAVHPSMVSWYEHYEPDWWDEVADQSSALVQYLDSRVVRGIRRQNNGQYPASIFYNFINRPSKALTYTERLKAVLVYVSQKRGSVTDSTAAFSAALSSIIEYSKPDDKAELMRVVEEIPQVKLMRPTDSDEWASQQGRFSNLEPEQARQQLEYLISTDTISDNRFAKIESVLLAGYQNIHTAKVCLDAISELRSKGSLSDTNISRLDNLERNLVFKLNYYKPIIDSVLTVYPAIPVVNEPDVTNPMQKILIQRGQVLTDLLGRLRNGSLEDFNYHSPVEVLAELKENSPVHKRPAIARISLEVIEKQFMWMQGWQNAINFDSYEERQMVKDLLESKRSKGDRLKVDRTLKAINAQLDFDSGITPDWNALDISILIDRKLTPLEAKLAHFMEQRDRPGISSVIRSAQTGKLAEIKNRPVILYVWKSLGNLELVEQTIESMEQQVNALLIDESAGFNRNSPLLAASEIMAALHDYGVDLVPDSLVAEVESQNPWQQGRAEFLTNYYIGKKQYRKAIELAEQGAELFDTAFFNSQLAIAYHHAGDREQSIKTAKKFLNNHGHGHWQYNTMKTIADGGPTN